MSRQYDDTHCNIMEKALAEILGVDVELIEELCVDIEPNLGNDDFLYGYCVEYPKLEDIDEKIQKSFDSSQLDEIPWGKLEYYDISEFGNTKADPLGWAAEWEEEYYNYINAPSEDNIINQLEEIENKIQKNKADEIIVKALVLSAFSITESYARSLVLNNIPNFDKSNLDDKLKNILKKYIISKISNNKGREGLFKEIAGKSIKAIPYYKEVRNPLAHNMFSAEVFNNTIIVKNKNDDETPFEIDKILEELIKFVEEPIENNNKNKRLF